ncbi:MAG: hypothetical protein EBU82_06220 [Flavobacteriia bacterium]|jgi:hypothetical protein|nr:hypothetical protein [Flavobacteriia bacterium]
MDICPPAIVTAACFLAVVLLDLYTHDWNRAPGHALFGIFAVLLMIFICQRASDGVAWILLGAPFVLVTFAWIVRAFAQMKKYDNEPAQEPAWGGNEVNQDQGCPCPCCGGMPCHCMRPCPQPRPCNPKPRKPNKCEPKHKPCNEDSYFELWLTTK